MEPTFGYLKLQLPNSAEQEFEISKPEITIGRGQTSDIVLQDTRVSRSPARFEFDGQRLAVLEEGFFRRTQGDGAVAIDPREREGARRDDLDADQLRVALGLRTDALLVDAPSDSQQTQESAA